jgi:small conductance mechanosensitive channel
MMFDFLKVQEIHKLIPSVERVKEKITYDELKINSYFDHFVSLLVDYTPNVISALIVLFVGLWLVKRIASLAEKAMTKRALDISLKSFLKSLVSIGLKIVLIVTVAGMIGIGTASFVTILGAAGLAVGLALQGSLSNFAGGVLILIFKPFKVADTIEAGGQSGEVLEIQIFNTILLTVDHKTIILPNGPLSNGTIVNYSRHGNLRIDIQLSVSHENDISLIEKTIQEVLSKNVMVLKEPKPGIFFGKITDNSLEISVKPYCHNDDTVKLKSELYKAFKETFEKQNVKQPLPQRMVQTVST